MDDGHSRYMQAALLLARRNLGQAWPNPAVGALLVKDQQIIAQGWTGLGGRPHAETVAIEAANGMAKGSTLYVTLEPCAHHGKTPPCVDAIINSGIARVVVACRDPHPEHGGGIKKLKAAGIEVVENICEKESRALNCGFFSVVEKKRPFVALKIATSADEKITYSSPYRGEVGRGALQGTLENIPASQVSPRPNPSPTGEGKRWLTGETARNYGHLLRSRYDAILTGIGTVIADDPLLTCRLPGLSDRSPVRVILDRRRRMPESCQIEKTKNQVAAWRLEMTDVPSVLTHLAEKGITRLLVEGGQQVTTAFLESGCVDTVYWFKAPLVVGNQGLAALSGGISLPEALNRFTHKDTKNLGSDTLEILCSQGS